MRTRLSGFSRIIVALTVCVSTVSAQSRPQAAGTRPTLTTEPRYDWNSDKHKWEWRSTVQSTTQGFSSDVQVELYGDHGRIHLGPSLVPPIHSGGSNGWWDLENLWVTPTQISATYRLNGMNKPKLTIDRRTGRIELRGLTMGIIGLGT